MHGDIQIHLGANKNQEPWRYAKLEQSVACLLVTTKNLLLALCYDGTLAVFDLMS